MKKSIGPKPLALPTPVWLVGSYDADDRPNIMTAAWGGICCSKPPCVSVSLRPATFSHGSLMERKAFTISIPSQDQAAAADYAGIVSGKKTDKFKQAGLTPIRSEAVDAPYVAECPLILECKVIHTIDIGLHTQFIGEILDIQADETVLGEKGLPDIEKVKPMIFAPEARTYHGIGGLIGQAFSIGKKFQ